jgi:HSP20 family protein
MVLPVLRRNHEARDHGVGPLRSWSSSPGWRQPWAEFSELYERMGRLLAEGVGGSVPGSGWWPAADVEETDQAYLVELELPGVKREDVSVEVAGGELAVTGEIKERQRMGLLRSRARRVGRFDYRVSLPACIEADQVSASLTGGVLTVQVPKTERDRPRKIPIRS